jgi:hypothetical protein
MARPSPLRCHAGATATSHIVALKMPSLRRPRRDGAGRAQCRGGVGCGAVRWGMVPRALDGGIGVVLHARGGAEAARLTWASSRARVGTLFTKRAP